VPSNILADPQNIYRIFIAFLPGILAFVIYRTLSDKDFGKIDKLDLLIVVFFTLLIEVLRSIITPSNYSNETGLLAYYLASGVILAFIPYPVHRGFLRYIFTNYEDYIVSEIGDIDYTDTGKVTRWTKILKENTPNSSSNLKDSKYIEIELEGGRPLDF